MSLVRRAAKRVYLTPAAHRLVPMPVARRLAETRAAQVWRTDATARDEATRQMTYLLGRSSRSHEIPELAREYLTVSRIRAELAWRRSLTLDVEGLAIVRELSHRSGVLISFIHQGRNGRIFEALSRNGVALTVPISPHLLHSTPGSEERRFLEIVSQGGTNVVSAKGSREVLTEVLLGSGCVAIAHDVFGHTPVTLLGRQVRCASGIAQLSLATRCPIVPVFAPRLGRGGSGRFRVGEPLLPGQFKDAAEMLQAVVSRFEPSILATPAEVETPLLRAIPVDEADLRTFGYSGEHVAGFLRPRE